MKDDGDQRDAADGKGTTAWQRTSTVGGRGAMRALMTMTTKQQSTNCAATEAEDKDGWQEAERGGGGGGATMVQWRRRNSFAIRSWRMEVEVLGC